MLKTILSLPAPWLALIGTIFGGAGLELTKRWLSRGQEKDKTATELRDELRSDVTELRERVDKLDDEVLKWRTDYWKIKEEYMNFRGLLATKIPTEVVEELRVMAHKFVQMNKLSDDDT